MSRNAKTEVVRALAQKVGALCLLDESGQTEPFALF